MIALLIFFLNDKPDNPDISHVYWLTWYSFFMITLITSLSLSLMTLSLGAGINIDGNVIRLNSGSARCSTGLLASNPKANVIKVKIKIVRYHTWIAIGCFLSLSIYLSIYLIYLIYLSLSLDFIWWLHKTMFLIMYLFFILFCFINFLMYFIHTYTVYMCVLYNIYIYVTYNVWWTQVVVKYCMISLMVSIAAPATEAGCTVITITHGKIN